ncbi:MAG: hypothetical protein EOR20_19935 [Mesorhizobium sp.]|nr:MAG: hypothetical protein EOR20_19935 [Mesorhizobium sp.]
MEGKFSMEFCSAVALARGRVSLAEFSQEVVDDPAIQRLINLSKLDFDPELTSSNPRSFCAAARVEISLEDGRVIDKTVHYMRAIRRTRWRKMSLCPNSRTAQDLC